MRTLLIGLLLTGLVGCAAQVRISSGRREDISAQARVFTIATRNLEDATRGRGGSPDEQTAAQAIATLHKDAETFARGAARWLSDDEVNTRYEKLIADWVKVRQTYPALKADKLLADSYDRVVHEWERLARSAGYAGKPYEKSLEQGK